jgi:acetyl esterase/lipase
MKYLFVFKIYFLTLFLANAQNKITPLYSEGVDCKNNLSEETDYDSSGRIFKKVINPEIWHYPSTESINTKDKTAVLVIPGGGYWGLWFDKEGIDVAEWLNSLGISAFVLKHRIPHWESKDCRSKVALLDAQRSIRIIRANSKKWGINPSKIGVLGFSAGGHLASTLSTHHDNGLDLSTIEIEKTSSRPDFSILVYPVITMKYPYTHMGSRENLLGKIPLEDSVTYFSNDLQVREDTPPAILIHTNEDEGVPAENSIKYYLALRKHKIPSAIHIWEGGEHGLGLAKNHKGSFKNWPKTCEQWMIERKLINN